MELKIPRENANDDQVIITKINVSSGDKVSEGEIILEFETSKVSAELSAPTSGTIELYDIQDGVEVRVDSVIGAIKKSTDARKSVTTSSEVENLAVLPKKTKVLANSDVVVSNAAAALIASGGVVKSESYWITSDDLSNTKQNKSREKREPIIEKSVSDTDSKSAPTSGLTYATVLGTNRKKLETKSLSYSSQYFNSTLGISISLSRRRVTDDFFESSILDLVLYECGCLLASKYKDLNSFYLGDNAVGIYDNVHAGFALDTGGNLTVVRINNLSSLQEVANSVIDKVVRFDEGKLKAEDVAPTTFTISDLSSGEADFILPLVNGEQAFILGIVRSKNGYKIFGTFDHRVTEGRRFSEFLTDLKIRIEAFGLPTGKVANTHCVMCLKTLEEERALGNIGLLQVYSDNGPEFICRNCYDGW